MKKISSNVAETLLRWLDVISLGAVALFSVIISLFDLFRYFGTDSLVAGRLDNITLFVLGLIAGYMAIERRNKDKIEDQLSIMESRLLQASEVDQNLWQDADLLRSVRQIVKSYIRIRSEGFSLFADRAKYELNQCRDTLEKMAQGSMKSRVESSWIFSRRAFEQAKGCLKATVPGEFEWWRTDSGRSYFELNQKALKRGIEITRVFIDEPVKLREAIDVLEQQRASGVRVYVVQPSHVSEELVENFLVMDDRVAVFLNRRDGKYITEYISMNEAEVKQALMRFDMLLRFSREVDDGLLKELKATS